MNRTTNYKLCQWEADDKIQRTDFNADNAKIDAALSGLARSKASALLTWALRPRRSMSAALTASPMRAAPAAPTAAGWL